MVYAVASETLQRFEVALGRRVHWARFDKRARERSTGYDHVVADAHNVLCLFPHAMAEANAFYSRDAQGILFGYFRASRTNPGNNLPGQMVFTCLSHDIIAHETTHAILDGIRSYFTEPTNIDVAAFHEAFADLSALFGHFAHRKVLLDTLQKTGGRLYDVMLRSEVPADDKKACLAGSDRASQSSRAIGYTVRRWPLNRAVCQAFAAIHGSCNGRLCRPKRFICSAHYGDHRRPR
jgi:hypothetical protein